MWTLTVRSPDTKPIDHQLKPGANSVGRRQDNDIVIADEAASRQHAVFHLDEQTNSVTIRDLGSRNGTYINRRKLTVKLDFKLNANDVVRIGMYEILVTLKGTTDLGEEPLEGLQPFSRELLLEAFDNHAVILYEVMQQLNNILDIDVALKEVSRLLQLTLGADKCAVILARDFDRLAELGFPRAIAEMAIAKRSTVLWPSKEASSQQLLTETARLMRVHTALCVPVVSGDQTIALIYMFKSRSDTRHFSSRDMQLALAVGQLAALTVERVSLMERVREEHRMRLLLQRINAPVEAEVLLRSYLKTGMMPKPAQLRCTVLVIEIADYEGLAKNLDAATFGELLERFTQDLTEIIFQFDGRLVTNIGPLFVALFGFAGKQKDPPTRAVSAGVEIANLIAARYSSGERKLEVGIGIQTAEAVAGVLIMKESVELTVWGQALSEAIALEKAARPNRVLIGSGTRAELGGFHTTSLGRIALREGDEPVEVFEVTV
jgi:class 3 adenylate cyclase/pSer/pThr/pTyr-binding forkhead associated (FHA) protein